EECVSSPDYRRRRQPERQPESEPVAQRAQPSRQHRIAGRRRPVRPTPSPERPGPYSASSAGRPAAPSTTSTTPPGRREAPASTEGKGAGGEAPTLAEAAPASTMDGGGALAGDLGAWIAAAGVEVAEWRALPGDVSPRRYARLFGAGGARGASFILAVYPP